MYQLASTSIYSVYTQTSYIVHVQISLHVSTSTLKLTTYKHQFQCRRSTSTCRSSTCTLYICACQHVHVCGQTVTCQTDQTGYTDAVDAVCGPFTFTESYKCTLHVWTLQASGFHLVLLRLALRLHALHFTTFFTLRKIKFSVQSDAQWPRYRRRHCQA